MMLTRKQGGKLASAGFAILFVAVRALSQACPPNQPPCLKDRIPMIGHGAAGNLAASFGCNCPGDSRRVITVAINASWDVDPQGNSTPGNTNVNVWKATVCAVSAWNNAHDD